MRALLSSFVFTTWGVCILGALDSSLLFFLPFAVDVGIVLLASRHPDLFWTYPILVSVTSLIGTATTFYSGQRLGEAGLSRFISRHKLQRVMVRARKKGAVAIAVLDFVPPPFPFTAFILVAGALEVNAWRFFGSLFCVRLVRFGIEAIFAVRFGSQVIGFIQSPVAEMIAIGFIGLIVIGSVVSLTAFIRSSRRQPEVPSPRRAA